MTPQEKHAISHRGNAFRALAPAIHDLVRGA
jgi:inosine/xanthosine triphosphate pyrophosphatase family protein